MKTKNKEIKKGDDMSACKKYKGLLMGLIDQELSPEEASEVNKHLHRCERCREEYEQLQETCNKIESISIKEPEDKILEKLWRSPYSRISKISGFLLVLFGWISLIVYTLVEWILHGSQGLFHKITIGAIILGFLVLLASVIRERIKGYKSDPYKEVIR